MPDDRKQGLKGPVGQPEETPQPEYSMEDFQRDFPAAGPPGMASAPPQFLPLGSYLPGLAGGGESRLKFPTVDVDPKAWSTISRLLGGPNPDPRVEEGWIYPLYHGTLKAFEEHDPSITRDLGMHFGNLEQATRRMSKFSPGRNIRPVNVDIENPVRLKDLFSRGFSWGKVANEIMQSDTHAKAIGSPEPGLKLTLDEKMELMNAAHNADHPTSWHPDPRQAFWKLVEDLIHKHGHDGVVYANDLEGGGDSFIVFDPEKITPRFGSPPASQLASYPGVARTWAESQGAMPSILSGFTPEDPMQSWVKPNQPAIQLTETGHAKPGTASSPNQAINDFVDEIMAQLGHGKKSGWEAEKAPSETYPALEKFGYAPSKWNMKKVLSPELYKNYDLLTSHGYKVQMDNAGQLHVLESLTDQWINITNWSPGQVKQWMGY